MESFDEQVGGRRGEWDGWGAAHGWMGPRRGMDGARGGERVDRRGVHLLVYLLTTVADSITIGVCGTSAIGPRVVVGVPSIFFTTSMPEVTLPNTA
jgi:hypothetical protein